MAGTIRYYNEFFNRVIESDIDLEGGDIRAALFTPSYIFDSSAQVFGDLSNEVNAAGYPAGGISLNGKSVGVGGAGVFDADDVVYPTSSFTVRGLVLYSYSATPEDNFLIAFFDYGEDITVRTNSFTNKWSTNGILKVEAGEVI